MTPMITLLCIALAGPAYESDALFVAEAADGKCDLTRAIDLIRGTPEAASRAPFRSSRRVPSTQRVPPKSTGRSGQIGPARRSAADQRQVARAVRGGPSGRQAARYQIELPNSAARGGGVSNGATDLINLIQTTVAPDTWEINGGRGSIFYFPNR